MVPALEHLIRQRLAVRHTPSHRLPRPSGPPKHRYSPGPSVAILVRMNAVSAGVRIGIDLGTTNSLAACLIDGRPTVIPNALGEILTPSAVSVGKDGSVVVGAAAKARASTHPEETACNFKRDMGTNREYLLSGRNFRPEALSALVLQELRESVEHYLGESVSEAVVTVPAYFGEEQRRATQAACEIAGLFVERLVNEPTAAAMAYGHPASEREARLAVFDLGGGTFDISVLELIDGVVEIQASAGDSRLGGEDFVEVMMDRCAALIMERHRIALPRSPIVTAKLRDGCERAKRTLSAGTTAELVLPNLPLTTGERTLGLALTREQVHQWWAPLLTRLRTPIRQALADAHLAPHDIDEVILVGGATRMPLVDEFVASVFNRQGVRTLPPDEAVALGAAVQAALKADDHHVSELVVTDVAPFTLGIDSGTELGGRLIGDIFSPIIDRGTVLPASRVKRFYTLADRQRTVEFNVYQGEHSTCQRNTKLGSGKVTGIPAAPAGEESIDVRFTYDLNGVLEVETTVVGTGKQQTLILDRSGRGLSAKAIQRAQEQVRHLKFHPRDALPNVTALDRAEALFINLVGEPREVLSQAIVQFRATLEGQDPVQIAECRELLMSITQRLQQH